MKSDKKRPAFRLLFCVLCLLWSLPCRLQAAEKADFIIAYTDKMLADIGPKDMATAMQMYVDEIARQAGYHGKTYRYGSIDELVSKALAGEVDFLALTSVDYLRLKKKLDLDLTLGQVKGGKIGAKYLILTNENKGYSKLADLKDKKLLVPKGDDIALLYLNTTLLKQKLAETKQFFSVVEEKNTPSQAVLPVFFGQADACVITDVSLKTMVELNPQLGKAMKVLISSPEFVTSVTAFRRSVSADIQQTTRDYGLKLKEQARGRQILMLFKIDGLKEIQETDLGSIKELMSEYDRVKAAKR